MDVMAPEIFSSRNGAKGRPRPHSFPLEKTVTKSVSIIRYRVTIRLSIDCNPGAMITGGDVTPLLQHEHSQVFERRILSLIRPRRAPGQYDIVRRSLVHGAIPGTSPGVGGHLESARHR